MNPNDATSNDENVRALGDVLSPGTTLMLVTESPQRSSRPLTVAQADADRIDILIDSRTEWATALRPGERVHATLSDTRHNNWASIDGTATISEDPSLVDQLWNPFAGAYFDDGNDTPGIAVLTITVTHGRYWSTPSGRLGSLISLAKAATGSDGRGGEQGDITTGDQTTIS